MSSLVYKHMVLLIGLVLIASGLVLPAALATFTVDSSLPVLYSEQPNGSSSNPNSLPVGQSYNFWYIVGEDNNLMVQPPSGSASCGSTPINCISITSYYGTTTSGSTFSQFFFIYTWIGGTLTSQTCYTGASCVPSVTTLPSTSCGGQLFCYQVQVSVTIPNALVGNYLSVSPKVADVAGNTISGTNFWGFVSAGTGYFIVNNQRVSPTSNLVFNTNTLTFTFNATNFANTITQINIVVVNSSQTGQPSKTLCYVGASGCFTTPTAVTSNFLFSPWSLYFANGNYNITASFVSGGTSYRVLSLIGGFGSTLPSLPFFTLGQLLMIVGAVMVVADLGFSVFRRRR